MMNIQTMIEKAIAQPVPPRVTLDMLEDEIGNHALTVQQMRSVTAAFSRQYAEADIERIRENQEDFAALFATLDDYTRLVSAQAERLSVMALLCEQKKEAETDV